MYYVDPYSGNVPTIQNKFENETRRHNQQRNANNNNKMTMKYEINVYTNKPTTPHHATLGIILSIHFLFIKAYVMGRDLLANYFIPGPAV